MKKILFFLFSLALLILSGIFIQKELNPEWKRYQSTFNKLKYQRVKAELQQAKKKFESPETQRKYQQLKKEYENAQAEIDKGKYDAVARRLEDADRDYNKILDKLQKAKIELQKLEISYKLGNSKEKEHLKEKIDSQRKQIELLKTGGNSIQQRKDNAVAEKAQLTQRRDELKRELERLTSNLNRLKRALVEIEDRKPQIKQIAIAPLDAVDRCPTCHLGVLEAKMADVAQHYTSHDVHEFGKFGCTSCHRGQGRATTAKEAHGDVGNWPKPLLRGKLIQSSCGKCHPSAKIPKAPILSFGRKLISELGCSGCHQIKGYLPAPQGTTRLPVASATQTGQAGDGKGENIGADLTDAGERLKPDWVKRWLKSPKSIDPTAKMPDFKLSDEDVESLTKYLMTLSSKETTQRFEVRMKSASMGRELVEDLGCLGCHEIKSNSPREMEQAISRGELDASKSKVYHREIGPSLTSVGSKLKANWLKKFLKAPKQIRIGTQARMPDFRLSDEEANALTAYLMSRSGANSPQKKEANLSQTASAVIGRKRFKELGCAGCHRIEGVKSAAIGPELTQIGDKSPDKLDFGMAKNLKHTLEDWLFAKLKDPSRFSLDAKMPDFRLSDEQAFAITVALMSITNEKVPESLRPRKQKEIPSQIATGKELFSKIGCITCHKAEGDKGGELGPFLNHEGSKVKEKWLSDFLKEPQKIRNRIKGRMPDFRLSDEEAFALTEYIMTLTDEEMFPKETIDEEKITIETLEYGKRLYQEYACFSCHKILGKGGEKGEIGPDLSHVGSRIKPDWEYIWLKNPPAVIPDTEMENFGMWDDEAEAITKYLQTLK